MTFVSFAYIANFGTVGVMKGKVVDFKKKENLQKKLQNKPKEKIKKIKDE